MRCVVVGAGVIGMLSAYYLARDGHEVTILERSAGPGEGASHGNAGMVVPSHAMPLAAPGVLWQGVKWMTNPESPFYLRPRLTPSLLSWTYRFWKASTRARAERAAPKLLALNLASATEYTRLSQELGGFGLEQRGLLMLSESQKGHAHELAAAEKANAWGLSAAGAPAVELSLSELAEREPDVGFAVAGAVLYPCDAHLDPTALMSRLREALDGLGVRIVYGTQIALRASGRAVTVNAARATDVAGGSARLDPDPFTGVPDCVVLAAGSWSGALAAQVGLKLPLEPGKGYSLSVPGPPLPLRTPAILTEARVAITPLPGALRIGGTLELAGFDAGVGPRRVKGIIDSATRALPGLARQALEATPAWHGFRPLSPDGLPYLGRSRTYGNLIVATGHAMMGVSAAPISGRIVAGLVSADEDTGSWLDDRLFDPERYST